MKLIKQTTLHYISGTSDKVYQVDLCQVGDEQYVVNFRYGRRGKTLKEGVKTTTPVKRLKAEKIFDQLLNGKIKKGYREVVEEQLSVPLEMTVNSRELGLREQAVLNRLAGKKHLRWSLERAIWRAGELKLKEAEPALIQLLNMAGPELQQYCLIWALGHCGSTSAVDAIQKIFKHSDSNNLQRIAREALKKLGNQTLKQELQRQALHTLPEALQHSLSSESFKLSLYTYLSQGNHQDSIVLEDLYFIGSQSIRKTLLELLLTIPLRPPYFHRVRHIFKMAEFHRDAPFFGRLAYRFATEKQMYNNPSYYYEYNQDDKSELKKADASKAYGNRTRDYLRRRVWRTLRRLGELADESYVPMAVATLLPFKDTDAQPEREVLIYDEDYNPQMNKVGPFGSYWAFNKILYNQNPNYQWSRSLLRYEDNQSTEFREEAFPELWEQYPGGLIHLLAESHCEEVHHFAVKAFHACQGLGEKLDPEDYLLLLSRPYKVTANLGFKLINNHFDTIPVDFLIAMALSVDDEARQASHQYLKTVDLNHQSLLDLLFSPFEDTRTFIQNHISSLSLPNEFYNLFFQLLINLKVGMELVAIELGHFFQQAQMAQYISMDFSLIQKCLRHPLNSLKELGAYLLTEIDSDSISGNILQELLLSPLEKVRQAGVQLINNQSDQELCLQVPLLVALCTHRADDVRILAHRIIERLLPQQNFKEQCFNELILTLFQKEPDEGVHASTIQLLNRHFKPLLPSLNLELVLDLTRSPSPHTQTLMGELLNANLSWSASLDCQTLIQLADHDILKIRQASWNLLLDKLPALKGNEEELAKVIRLFASKWEDSRNFGQIKIANQLEESDWTPNLLISLCDSIYDDIRQFGRQMITRYFKAENGQEYLLKLSQHPSPDLQLFATNYLERYAKDNPERLHSLMPYFKSVLGQINRSRVAKDRILMFLAHESVQSEGCANLIAPLFEWYAATIAIGDKASAIESLLNIHLKYPHIPISLEVQEVQLAI